MKQSARSKVVLFLSVIILTFLIGSCKKDGGQGSANTPRTTNVPDEFVGIWYYGDVSSFEIFSNGHYDNSVGSGQYYSFNKNGTFEFAYRNYVMEGRCANIGGAYRKGTFTVEGNKLTLYDNYAKLLEEHSCNPSSNYDKDTEKKNEVIFAQPGEDNYGSHGIYLNNPGQGASFFRKM